VIRADSAVAIVRQVRVLGTAAYPILSGISTPVARAFKLGSDHLPCSER